jgi:hypothetical protein
MKKNAFFTHRRKSFTKKLKYGFQKSSKHKIQYTASPQSIQEHISTKNQKLQQILLCNEKKLLYCQTK